VPLIAALVVGILVGLHVATWGMYKDAIHEGFHVARYFRSVIVGATLALLLRPYTDLDLTNAGGLVVYFGMVYVCERIVVEIWKTFFRDENQAKYTIPMQFQLLRTPIRSRGLRAAVGVLCLVVLGLAGLGINGLQGASLPVNPVIAALAVGSVGGWLTAVGGAWKDAPVEGFEPLKFFRSPLMTMAFALALAPFTDRWLFLAMAALGYERGAVETYKTFFFPNKPRGKFAGKPIVDSSMLTRRVKFAYLFGFIWLVVAAAYSAAWTQPSRGVFGVRGGTPSPTTAS